MRRGRMPQTGRSVREGWAGRPACAPAQLEGPSAVAVTEKGRKTTAVLRFSERMSAVDKVLLADTILACQW